MELCWCSFASISLQFHSLEIEMDKGTLCGLSHDLRGKNKMQIQKSRKNPVSLEEEKNLGLGVPWWSPGWCWTWRQQTQQLVCRSCQPGAGRSTAGWRKTWWCEGWTEFPNELRPDASGRRSLVTVRLKNKTTKKKHNKRLWSLENRTYITS